MRTYLVGQRDLKAARLAHQSPEAHAMHEAAWHFHRKVLKAGVGGQYGTHKDGNPILATPEQVREASHRIGGYDRMGEFVRACIQHNIDTINRRYGTGDLGPLEILDPIHSPGHAARRADRWRTRGFTNVHITTTKP